MKKVAKLIGLTQKVPPLIFSKYRKFEDYFTEKENRKWNERIEDIVREVIRISEIKVISIKEYKTLHRKFKILPEIGNLMANHMLVVASIIGIVPLKSYKWVIGGVEREMKMLENIFLNLPDRNIVMENIRYSTEVVIRHKIHSVRGRGTSYVSW